MCTGIFDKWVSMKLYFCNFNKCSHLVDMIKNVLFDILFFVLKFFFAFFSLTNLRCFWRLKKCGVEIKKLLLFLPFMQCMVRQKLKISLRVQIRSKYFSFIYFLFIFCVKNIQYACTEVDLHSLQFTLPYYLGKKQICVILLLITFFRSWYFRGYVYVLQTHIFFQTGTDNTSNFLLQDTFDGGSRFIVSSDVIEKQNPEHCHDFICYRLSKVFFQWSACISTFIMECPIPVKRGLSHFCLASQEHFLR